MAELVFFFSKIERWEAEQASFHPLYCMQATYPRAGVALIYSHEPISNSKFLHLYKAILHNYVRFWGDIQTQTITFFPWSSKAHVHYFTQNVFRNQAFINKEGKMTWKEVKNLRKKKYILCTVSNSLWSIWLFCVSRVYWWNKLKIPVSHICGIPNNYKDKRSSP